MNGDFSRGTNPDSKRGRRYRRVLLKQGGLLLDSDHAAGVDALQREDRDILRHVACAHGSSDSGFLCTPGRLLALFDSSSGLRVISGNPRLTIDYRHRYLNRQPSLSIDASGGAAARVRIPLRAAAQQLAIWARAELSTSLGIGAVSRALSADSPPAEFTRLAFSLPAAVDQIELTIPAGAQVWIALIESDDDAGEAPSFFSAQGSYQIDGMTFVLRADTTFPESAFPEAAGFWSAGSPAAPPLDGLLADFLSSGDLVAAYLEGWERHVTAIVDPGLRERALGRVDTCTRSEALAQVKLARVVGIPHDADTVDAVSAAFAAVQASAGTVSISQHEAAETDDPCALPALEGYTGADNRLYRFEVHTGGPLSSVRIKWSRNNGSELFPADIDSNNQLLVSKDVPLAANALVEVLSEVIDLGDDAHARVGPAGFVAAQRAVGTLARLVELDTVASNHRVFQLVDPLDIALPISIVSDVLPRLGDLDQARLRLCRWDGVLDPGALANGGPISAGPHEIEDGIRLTLSNTGSFDPGQYWQYEARVAGANANGPLPIEPHGPERLFAPLALFIFRGPSEPLELLAWLDHRYPRLCSIAADDVGYDGARVESESQTVQEALDELFDRGPEIITAGCGELVVRPENNLQAVFDSIPTGADAKVCIHPGSFNLTQRVLVENKGHLVIAGAGRGTRIVSSTLDQLLEFRSCASVTLEQVALLPRAEAVGESGVLSFVDCEEVSLRALHVQCGSAPTRRLSAIRARRSAPDRLFRRIRIADCNLVVGHAQTGIRVTDADAVEISGNRLQTAPTALNWAQLTQTPEIAAWLGHLLLDDPYVGEPEDIGLSDDWALGDNPGRLGDPGLDGRPRMIAQLSSWGDRFMVFTSHPSLATEAFWRGLLDANPMRGAGTPNVAPEWIIANLRRLRANVVRWLFQGGTSVAIPAGPVLNALNPLRTELVRIASFAAGGQGVVVGTRRAPRLLSGEALPDLSLPPRAPDIRVSDNRIDGFVQGIHLGSSYNRRSDERGRHLRLYRAHVQRNTVFVRVPPMARERHGIFVGNAMNLQIMENMVELDSVSAADLPNAPRTDGIRVWGAHGPMLLVTGNHTAGVSTGIRVVAEIPGHGGDAGVVWTVRDNAYGGVGTPQVLAL
jgi:hypothetical protein